MSALVLTILLSYGIGSIPTAFLIGKLVKRIDIRKHGSGNVGATNVFRVVGKKWGIAVFAIDMLKGFFPVMGLAKWLPSEALDPFVGSLICGIAAIVGHTWTIWLGSRGGKGVATSAGVFLGLAPQAAGSAFLVWTGIFIWKRYVSVASLVTALSFPVLVLVFYHQEDFFKFLFPISLCLTIFMFYTHRENVRRLLNGTEKRLI